MENNIKFQLENDPIISELYKKYKKNKPGKIKSFEFIEIYKNLLWLWYSQEKIHEYFELEEDYKDFIINFL